MVEHQTELLSSMNFIRQAMLSDTSVCDALISLFEGAHDKHPGLIMTSAGAKEDKNRKKSTDLTVTGEMLDTIELTNYLQQLNLIIQNYVNFFPACDSYSPWGLIEPPVIKKYQPNEAFFAYHTERMSAQPPNSARHLVFMTYLNTVSDGGETEWLHQRVKITPEKGKTVIWPADWTHTHRGLPSPSQVKYIISGWLSYTG